MFFYVINSSITEERSLKNIHKEVMDFSEYLLEPLVAVTVLCGVYLILISNSSRKKKNGFYTLPDWNFFLKKIWSLYVIKNWKKSRVNEEIQLIPATEEPLVLTDDVCDSQSIFGTNKDGFSLLVTFTRKSHRISEVILILTLPDGRCFQLPNQHDSMIFDGSSETWRAACLTFDVIEPFSRWRIIFNGLLREKNKTSFRNELEELRHVRFNFIWIAASGPLRTPDDSSDNLMAEAIAIEPWKDSSWMHGITHSPKRGYDQFGSMVGTVTMDEQKETLITSIYGLRQRRWQPEIASLRRSLTIFGSACDGTVYQIGVESFTRGLTQVKSGNIRIPNGVIASIETVDIDLSTIGEYDSEIPKALTIKFSTNSRNFTLFLSLNKSETKTFRSRKWENIIIPFQGGINNYQGSGFLQLWYRYRGEMPLEQYINMKQLTWLKLKDLDTTIPLCATFHERIASCPEAVGGKGASLALLSSVVTNEYDVPKGFCLTTRSLDCQLKHNLELQEVVKVIEDVTSNYSEYALKSACERATQLFESTPVCNLVKDHVVSAFEDLCDSENNLLNSKDLYFAVRSSGIGEDSEELSAAGQNATILGCKSIEDVLIGIQKCWSSLFTFQSVEYRRQHGQPVQSGMGVVVQVMVEARAAGVMFTRHPNTGNPSNIFITSNYGLGESVVSGQVEPDTIIVERSYHNKLKIKSIEIGKKGQRIVLDKSKRTGDSGTQTLQLEQKESSSLSISEEECLLLGNIAIQQEMLWGLPRDIEWAIVQDRIYLLQARPITSLNSWSEFELAHELDSPIMSEDDLLTFANTGEVLSDSYSPLSHSVVAAQLNNSIAAANGLPVSEYFLGLMTCTHHHMGLNVLNTFLRENEEKITIRSKIMDLAIFGHIVTDEKMHSIGIHRNEAKGKTAMLGLLKDMTYFLWTSKSNSEEATIHADRLTVDLKNCKTSLEMYKLIDMKIVALYENANYHSSTSTASVFSQILFLTILLEGRNDFTIENYTDIATILSSCTNVISADIPEGLHKLAVAIQSSGKSEEFCNQNPEAVLKWLEQNSQDVFQMLTLFLEKHGHRCIKEFDLLTDPWSIDPTALIKTLQATVKIPMKNKASDGSAKSTEELIKKLVSPIKNFTKKILKYVIPMCQKSVSRREMTKAALILIVHKVRLAYRELGNQMVKEWRLPDQKLIFFMTHKELGRYLITRNPGYVTKAILRRRYFSRWDRLQFSELIWGFPQPLTSQNTEVYRGSVNNVKIMGTPVCSGDIVSRACVINSISEIDQLQPGDILITHCTDIGWSPYFPLLGGVVTELGGLISHGAVVAREYGLPCIVGAQGATSVFKTGDTVLLSAISGALENLEDSPLSCKLED